MDWNFERCESPEFIRIVTSGVFRCSKFGEMFDDLTSLEYWRNGVPLLFDHRKLDLLSIDPIELMHGAEHFLRKNPELAFTPIAILFDDAESLEMGERYGEITEDHSLADVRRFLRENEAVDWISSYFVSILAVSNFLYLAFIVGSS